MIPLPWLLPDARPRTEAEWAERCLAEEEERLLRGSQTRWVLPEEWREAS